MPDRLRTFIAIEVPATLRKRLGLLRQSFAEVDAQVKWVEPESIHLTLLFLGEIDNRELIEVCRVVKQVAENTEPFQFSVEGVGCFPNPRRPKVLWVGISAGKEDLQALHDALEEPLLELGCYRREDRPYTPHITLGRIKGEDIGEAFAPILLNQRAWQGGQVGVGSIQVLSSELRPRGPEYTLLSEVDLGG